MTIKQMYFSILYLTEYSEECSMKIFGKPTWELTSEEWDIVERETEEGVYL
ncbi:MAG: hypothetical protein E6392_07250 [Staphylococcus epidermidis]|jgi:hypothetical protein|uniref:Uncharacterized protein n=1 Tax=Staphylococcus aureus TaxID=1280 RepID=A0A9P2Z041_STAAU|nr:MULTISPECIES: hypothetical protein [Staphylococcus]MDU1258394.1 hypothetical protein [Clostridium perfringens]MDU6314250.1 hypothetical protein [Enterococcus faecalis]MDU1728215.1 hypothetical protein [Staphylococcus epidermidis]MDU6915829.1 hypothetical protein [Staphylococcus epidermidis]GBV21790.1 hypothetical protein M1K003_2813 [Staphylococcus aureus]